LLAQLVTSATRFFAQALELGELESTGLSYRYAIAFPNGLRRSTRKQIQAAARVTSSTTD